MKFTIKGGKENEVIELYLEQDGDMVFLKGTDGKDIKFIMDFKDGTFCRSTEAELDGLKTDESGRIIEK